MDKEIILYNLLKEARTEQKLSQEELARMVGTTRQTIISIEKNLFNPVAVYIPANQTVYSRSTYNYNYLKGFVEVDFSGKRLQDTFISHANGSVQVLVKNKDDWRYSSF